MTTSLTVLGEGAWGTAIAQLLAENGCTVRLWCHDPLVAQLIAQTGFNERYLPGIPLHPNIIPCVELKSALSGSAYVFETTPVKYLRSVLRAAAPFCSPDLVWVVLSKGIENGTLMLPAQMIDDVLGYSPSKAVLAGPSFAHDLVRKQITAVTIAAQNCNLGNALQQLLANDYFRPYVSLDVTGAQLGGALKNVLALGVGLLDGAGYSDNPKAFLFTNGLHEMAKLARSLGAMPETIYGFSGVGDLVASATGNQSRNLLVGKRLGAGHALEAILQETGYIPEGINTVKSIYELATRENLKLPVCVGIYEVIFLKKSIRLFLHDLMAQPLGRECVLG